VVYKRAVIMLRTLHTLLRSLPANRFHRACRRSQNTGAYALTYVIRAGRLDGDGKPPGRPGVGAGADNSGTGGGTCRAEVGGHFRTYAFTSVATPSGFLNASVYFLDAKAGREENGYQNRERKCPAS